MSDIYLEKDGRLHKLVDLGVTTLPDEAGGFRHAYGELVVPGDAAGNPVATSGIQAVKIDQTTPGTTNLVEAKTQTRRDGGVLHRSAIVAVDKLAVPASPTVTDVATGGSLAQGTTYNATVAAANRFGPTTVPSVGSVTTAGSGGSVHAVQLTIAQVANAEYYDLFMSTAANPLFVARITETQRAAGCTVTAVGTVTGTSPGAGLVNVNVVGTGLASNVAPFSINNAYTPALVTPVACAGHSAALINFKLSVTDLRSLPTIAYAIFWQNQLVSSDWHMIAQATLSLVTAVRQPLLQEVGVNVFGATGLVVLIDTLTGQGASVDVTVDLC